MPPVLFHHSLPSQKRLFLKDHFETFCYTIQGSSKHSPDDKRPRSPSWELILFRRWDLAFLEEEAAGGGEDSPYCCQENPYIKSPGTTATATSTSGDKHALDLALSSSTPPRLSLDQVSTRGPSSKGQAPRLSFASSSPAGPSVWLS